MTTHLQPSPAEEPEITGNSRGGYRYRWMVLAIVLVADVMDLLDATIANLAGPSIRADLGGGESTLQWVLAAYTLAFAIGLVTSGRLGDLVGRREMFLIGMVGFTAASLACGLAPSAGVLIGARVAQGLFGATMIPQGLAMVKQAFPPQDLAKAFIPFGPVMGLAAVLGPIIAGVLIDVDLFGTGWRMVFLINLPVGVIATLLAFRYLPPMPMSERRHRLDLFGSTLITAASAALIYPLVQGRQAGWPGWTFALMGASVVLFGLFVMNERRSANPVIEPSLFKHRGYVAGLLLLLTFFAGLAGFLLVFNLFVQLGLGFKPLYAGLVLTPFAFGIAVGSALSGAWLGPKLGRAVMHVGLIGILLGIIMLALTIEQWDLDVSGWQLAPGTLVAGIGAGLIFPPMFNLILADLDEHEVGTGAGLLNAVQQFGGAAGVAVLGTIFFQLLPQDGFGDSFGTVLGVAIGCWVASFAVVFLLPRRPREDSIPS